MDLEKRLELANQQPTEEILTLDELSHLFETNDHPKHYIGYEISGMLHLGMIFVTRYKIEDLLKAGCECTVFLADWHSWINNKLGGKMENIQAAAKYFEEAFKFFFKGQRRFRTVLGSELYEDNLGYWEKVIKISKMATLARVTRSLTIMGRKESEAQNFAQFIYPPMQSADMWELDVDIVHAGLDQRKVHVLHREIAEKLKIKKPIALHTHMLAGLGKPEFGGLDENPKLDRVISSKMSKSKPWTAIFIHDSKKQIYDKIEKAWCPEGQIELNPILDIVKQIIFREKKIFEIERDPEFGGPITVQDYEELERLFKQREIHPQDLKRSVSRELSEILKPLREYFEKKSELLKVFKEAEITR